MTRTLTFFVACGLLAAACSPSDGGGTSSIPSIPFREDGRLVFMNEEGPVVDIAIEIADDDSSRARGLMQRLSLPERSGMLFAFDRAGTQSFYMANTQMALDFFFVAADSTIVNTVKYARPLALDPILSTGPAQYVVEVPAGFVDTWGLIAGNRVRWSRR